MLPVGGLCGVLIGRINQTPGFYNMKVIEQSVIGVFIVLGVEFIAGLILNIWLNLGIWDYSSLPFNIWGQVCLPFALLWLILMPFAIWLEDTIRWKLWREGWNYSLFSIYIEFFTLK